MNIFLIGATGRVGSVLLKKAISDEHTISAVVREPSRLSCETSYLNIFKGTILDEELLLKSMNNCDLVISALNTDGSTTLSEAMPLIIKVMNCYKIKRIITIGTAGILQARVDPSIYRFQSSESKRKSTWAAEEHLKAYLALKKSNLDWTIVCPTYLPDGKHTGEYRIEKDLLPINGTSISVYDTADFTYSQIFTNEFNQCRVGIAY